MSLLFPLIAAQHPMRIGPALLKHIKQGIPVTRIRVWFTHGQLHQLFSHNLAKHYPLEMTLAPGRDMEQKIDCRLFQVPWDIDLKKKKRANQYEVTIAPDPKPPEEPSREELELADAVMEPFYLQAATEYRLIRQAVEREMILEHSRRVTAQLRSRDNEHG